MIRELFAVVCATAIVSGCVGEDVPLTSADGGTAETGGSENPGPKDEKLCNAGDSRPCACSAKKRGEQICASDERRYEACECKSDQGTGGGSDDGRICEPGMEYGCTADGKPGYRTCADSGKKFLEDECIPRPVCVPGATQCCVDSKNRAGVQTCKKDASGFTACEPFEEEPEPEPSGTGGTTGTGGSTSGTGGAPAQGQEDYLATYEIADDVLSYVQEVTFSGMLNRVGWRNFCSTNMNQEPVPQSLAWQEGDTWKCDFSALPGTTMTANVKTQYMVGVSAVNSEVVHDNQSWACWEDWKAPCSQGSGCYRPAMTFKIKNVKTGKTATLTIPGDWGGYELSAIWNQRSEGGCNIEFRLP